ncbi:protein-disulfide isomerase [Pectobacterium zantedeschiae]|uniref:DsbA family protein n=2 Tax=Pectobacterium zantedeschiae TaxID=2034769 RepID=A0A9X8P691_9GAMM|nr:protein-disulfide isomerase [Pectobacterium zantedeschiae]RYC42042.1 protein-disulfide isomerase [Pectobacterium zantedeschiae]RYC45279.1 DsbA family protein [Pectobacterium zantedeschiae]
MAKVLTYLFDPLCGWCYGASSTVTAASQLPDVTLQLMPTGLFSGQGARLMDDDFAQYAWSNDQRIARLTGQRFTENYRQQVLSDQSQAFDSGPATVALTAVSLTAPEHELEALKAIQHARYIDGNNVTSREMLAGWLEQRGLHEAANLIAQPDNALLQANQSRINYARLLMQEFGAQGVPNFILDDGKERRILPTGKVFSNSQDFIQEINNA